MEDLKQKLSELFDLYGITQDEVPEFCEQITECLEQLKDEWLNA